MVEIDLRKKENYKQKIDAVQKQIVVVGSYTDRANAVKKQEELKAKGEDSFLLAYKE
ncbi:hypothetical protein [Clostridium perfringens]|uniref:hypothetical protein n=1 Tax=Clostridium perfringens TaxID=1502 RepID=UPI0039EC4070